MRIPLVYNERVVLPAVIISQRGMNFISFIIDTGSVDSLLSPKDLAAMQLQVTNAKEHIGFGGATFDAALLNRVKMKISNEEKKIVELRVKLKALKTRRIAEDKKALAESLPSILGMDFLKANGFSLHIIPEEGLAYLEK